jgi:hypothetical protein
MQQGTRYGTTTHSRKVVQDSDAYGCSGSGEIRATDGKIKAPTSVWGMWLVGLRVLGIGERLLAGACIAKFNEFNTSSAIGRRFAGVDHRYDRAG